MRFSFCFLCQDLRLNTDNVLRWEERERREREMHPCLYKACIELFRKATNRMNKCIGSEHWHQRNLVYVLLNNGVRFLGLKSHSTKFSIRKKRERHVTRKIKDMVCSGFNTLRSFAEVLLHGSWDYLWTVLTRTRHVTRAINTLYVVPFHRRLALYIQFNTQRMKINFKTINKKCAWMITFFFFQSSLLFIAIITFVSFLLCPDKMLYVHINRLH